MHAVGPSASYETCRDCDHDEAWCYMCANSKRVALFCHCRLLQRVNSFSHCNSNTRWFKTLESALYHRFRLRVFSFVYTALPDYGSKKSDSGKLFKKILKTAYRITPHSQRSYIFSSQPSISFQRITIHSQYRITSFRQID